MKQTNPLVSAIPEDATNRTNEDQCCSADSIVINNIENNDECVSNGIEIPKRESIAENLANAITSEAVSISQDIGSKAIDLMFRSVQRISLEVQILDHLSRHLRGFDSTLQLVPFGSATYGFGGSSTDFNILVTTETGNNIFVCYPHALNKRDRFDALCVFSGAWNENSHEVQHSFETFIKTSSLQTDFQVLEPIHGDRVQNRRLQAIHKSSAILCQIHFDLNFETAKSSQIIRNCILHSPLCE